MIDLLNLQPTKISRDLKGKFMLIYSMPKAGKTSLATRIPKSLLIGFEHGFNALSNIKAIDCPSWVTMKEVLRELKKQEVKDTFDSIIIDTASVAWDRCSDYICQQMGIKELADAGFGKGFKSCSKEFEKVFREITLMGYGLVFLAHSEEKIPFGGDESQAYIAPMLDKRPYRIINTMVDIIACIDVTDDGERYLQMRATPKMFAGSRFQYLPDRIPLDYNILVNSLADAIDKQAAADGGEITDDRSDLPAVEVKRPFNETMEEAKAVWNAILDKDDSDSRMDQLEDTIEDIFGSPIKLSTVSPKQQDMLELVILELKDILTTL